MKLEDNNSNELIVRKISRFTRPAGSDRPLCISCFDNVTRDSVYMALTMGQAERLKSFLADNF